MRERKYKSKKAELLKKSREAMLTATNVYNNPLIQFKSETFITLSIIAWTYLLHAYYESKGITIVFINKKVARSLTNIQNMALENIGIWKPVWIKAILQ